MPEDCVIIKPNRLHAPCSVCSTIPERPHIVGLVVFCPSHCSDCNAATPEERRGMELSA
jgi:hypothetical protein